MQPSIDLSQLAAVTAPVQPTTMLTMSMQRMSIAVSFFMGTTIRGFLY